MFGNESSTLIVGSNSLALKTYFDTHKDQYKTNDLEPIKGRVMNDFSLNNDKIFFAHDMALNQYWMDEVNIALQNLIIQRI